MNVAIIGSRDYSDLNAVARFVRKLKAKYPNATVVSGGARGVDRTAEHVAQRIGLEVITIRPLEVEDGFIVQRHDKAGNTHVHNTRTLTKYETWGQAAYARNLEIVDAADQVVAFWDGTSRGTLHGKEYAEREGKPVHIYLDNSDTPEPATYVGGVQLTAA